MKKSFFMLIFMFLLVGCGTTIYSNGGNYETEEKKPSITVESSCGWGTARGSYTISTSEHGAICSGWGYSDKETAIEHPLQIKSEGYKIIVTLADDSVKTVTMTSGDSQLISCESGLFNGYLYVIIT